MAGGRRRGSSAAAAAQTDECCRAAWVQWKRQGSGRDQRCRTWGRRGAVQVDFWRQRNKIKGTRCSQKKIKEKLNEVNPPKYSVCRYDSVLLPSFICVSPSLLLRIPGLGEFGILETSICACVGPTAPPPLNSDSICWVGGIAAAVTETGTGAGPVVRWILNEPCFNC